MRTGTGSCAMAFWLAEPTPWRHDRTFVRRIHCLHRHTTNQVVSIDAHVYHTRTCTSPPSIPAISSSSIRPCPMPSAKSSGSHWSHMVLHAFSELTTTTDHAMSVLTSDHQTTPRDGAIPLQSLDIRSRTPMTSRTHTPNPEAERLLPTASTSASSPAPDDDERKPRSAGLDLVPTQTDKAALASIVVSFGLCTRHQGRID